MTLILIMQIGHATPSAGCGRPAAGRTLSGFACASRERRDADVPPAPRSAPPIREGVLKREQSGATEPCRLAEREVHKVILAGGPCVHGRSPEVAAGTLLQRPGAVNHVAPPRGVGPCFGCRAPAGRGSATIDGRTGAASRAGAAARPRQGGPEGPGRGARPPA